jgi:hypothetical protein
MAPAPPIQVDNPSKTGRNQELILDTLQHLLDNLDDTCRTFLGAQFEGYVKGLIGDRNNPRSAYIAHGSLRGRPTTAAVTGGRNGDISIPPGYAATIVNTEGAFFNSRFTVSNGRFQGGTAQARRAILLHEIAHGLELLEHDRDNQAAVNRNDQQIWENCQGTIR